MSSVRRLLDGLEEMLKNWQLSAGALEALGRRLPEGAEELAAEQLLLEVAVARDELDSLELEAMEAVVAQEEAAELEYRAQQVTRPGVPQGRRQ